MPGPTGDAANQRLGAKDFSGAMRAAKRVGDDAVSIVKACSAVKGDDKASDKLDAVSADALIQHSQLLSLLVGL